jgi:hypothetical protein
VDLLENDILKAGLHGPVSMAQVSRFASLRFPGGGVEIAVAVTAIRFLLENDLIRVGDISGHEFSASDSPAEETLWRIEDGWWALGHEPSPGELGWIENTELGNVRATEPWLIRTFGIAA